MSRHLQLQIEMAASGCISGTLGEWPDLNRALQYRYPSDTPAIKIVKKCKRLLERYSVVTAEQFRIIDEQYGGLEVWWPDPDHAMQETAEWLRCGASAISMVSNINGTEDHPEKEPWWEKLTPIDECYTRGLLMVRGIRYHAVRFQNASPVGYFIATEYVDDLPSVQS